MQRPVDAAMGEERTEKRTMRDLWADCVGDALQHSGEEPVYLTLCGARGLDIETLVGRGHLHRYPTNPAIRQEDLDKVIAVESRPDAVYELKRRFPGLRVVDRDFSSFVHSESMIAWPTGEHRDFCRARVVNLDLNSPLQIELREGQLVFPQLVWVEKLARIHAHSPHLNWTLCLTLAAQIEWDAEIERKVKVFLAENLAALGRFRAAAERLLGGEMIVGIEQGEGELDLSSLQALDQQHMLMALVPKKVAQFSTAIGWRIDTRENLRYGGSGERAAMVTWILEFNWDERGSSEPTSLYRESAAAAIETPGQIAEDGAISSISGD